MSLAIFKPCADQQSSVSTLAQQINEKHDNHLQAMADAIQFAKETGDLLIQLKEKLPHGQFGKFVRQHLTFKERTAQEYMKLAREWDTLNLNPQRVAHLSLREVLKMCRKPAPQKVADRHHLEIKPLINLLESVKAAVESRAYVEQSDCFIFNNRRVHTHNGDLHFSAPCDLPWHGAVQATKLRQLLRASDFQSFHHKQIGSALRIVGKKFRSLLPIELDILVPLDQVSEDLEWKELPPEFEGAIAMVHPSASTMESEWQLVCLHLTSDFIEATDRNQITRYRIETGIENRLLVRADSIQPMVGHKMTQFAVDQNWIHFRNDADLVMSAKITIPKAVDIRDSFEKLDEFMIPNHGVPVTFTGRIKKAVKSVLPAAKNEWGASYLKLLIDDNKIVVAAKDSDDFFIERMIDCHYGGEPRELTVRADNFLKLVDVSMECILTERSLIAQKDQFEYAICVA